MEVLPESCLWFLRKFAEHFEQLNLRHQTEEPTKKRKSHHIDCRNQFDLLDDVVY